VTNAQCLAMIQCVGCRQEDRNYCARICCSHAIKNALKLKEINPRMDIYVLFRDMRPYGFREDYYREASDKDVRFIRYEPQDKPKVEVVNEGGQQVLRIAVTDPILGTELGIDADALALSAAIIPSAGSKDIAGLFKVTLNPDGFFQEAHVKLRPVDFGAEGVYLCGTAHYPKHITEAISQAYGAAGRALTLLSHDTVTASGSVCIVNESECVSCGACITACTYGAIEFYETPQGRKAKVNPVLCKGDGLCNTKCPTGAIVLKHYIDEAIIDQIDAAVPDAFVA
jgi:heterodisulfide reductase subunit A